VNMMDKSKIGRPGRRQQTFKVRGKFSRIAAPAIMLGVCFPLLLLGQFGFLDALDSVRKIILILVGFGSVIFFHELGHFISAKYFGIRCDVFSLGIGPRLCGWRKGMGFSFGSTQIGPVALSPASEGNTTVIRTDVGETDYRLSWLPFGGYVRMLGQDDMDPTKVSDDPASYLKKPIWQRMVVISCGVIMNLIFAVIIFALVFRVGVDFPPAVVGGLAYNSPAEKSGLQVGDKIVSINHHLPAGFLEFTDLGAAAALDGRGEPVSLQYLRGSDPTPHSVDVVPVFNPDTQLLAFGVNSTYSLQIADMSEQDLQTVDRQYPELKGIVPGSTIRTCNGIPVNDWGELYAAIQNCQGRPVNLGLTAPDQAQKPYTIIFSPMLEPRVGVENNPPLLEMYPRIKIIVVLPDSAGAAAGLKPDDVIVRVGTLANPSMEQFVKTIQDNPGESLSIEVLRNSNAVTAHAMPDKKYGQGDLGVTAIYDYADSTVGHVTDDGARLHIQPGSKLIAIGVGEAVSDAHTMIVRKRIDSWFDVFGVLQGLSNSQLVTLYFDQGPPIELMPTDAQVAVGDQYEYELSISLILQPLMQLQRADNIGIAVQMGLNHTWNWILRTYLTLRGLGTGTISPSQLHSIVGIASVTYIAEQTYGIMYLLFLLGVISVNLAVINFLPLPILDGGLFVMLIIEKIRGRPLSLKIQAAIQLVGIILIVALFLYITVFNDLPMIFHS
jgi:regulator of sigma E protease